MDPVAHINGREVSQSTKDHGIQKIAVVRKTQLKSRKQKLEKPKRKVYQVVPKFNFGDSSNSFIAIDNKKEQESNPTAFKNSGHTFTLPSRGFENESTSELDKKSLNMFGSNDEQINLDDYYVRCGSAASNCIEDKFEWTDEYKSLGMAISDNGDKKQTSYQDNCSVDSGRLQDFIADRYVLEKKRQIEVVKITIPLEVAECAVNIFYSEVSNRSSLDRGQRKPLFALVDLILIEVAKYELLSDELKEPSTETSLRKAVKIEIPLETAKSVIRTCYSESAKDFHFDSNVERPVFLVMDLILHEVVKYKRDSTQQNSSCSIEREIVKIKIPQELAKSVVDISKSLIDRGIVKPPVFVVMDVISDEVEKYSLFDGAIKQQEIVAIEISLPIAKCAVNTFYSELTKWILLEPGLNRPMFEVMHLIQNEVLNYKLLEDESVRKRETGGAKSQSRVPSNFDELCSMAAECEANLGRMCDFLENVDYPDSSRSSIPTFVANILLILAILAVLVFPAALSMFRSDVGAFLEEAMSDDV